MKGVIGMRIVEQFCQVKERTSILKAEYPTECLFQVFVKGRLQPKSTYSIEGDQINFGFDCLAPGDVVQMFYLIAKDSGKESAKDSAKE